MQAEADISKELKNTVTNLQRELVMCGEMQSQQRDVVTHINALRYDATNAMLSQDSYRYHLNGMFVKICFNIKNNSLNFVLKILAAKLI